MIKGHFFRNSRRLLKVYFFERNTWIIFVCHDFTDFEKKKNRIGELGEVSVGMLNMNWLSFAMVKMSWVR